MTQTTKKQHYVPQLLLKHFSEKGRLCIFDSTRNIFRENILTKNEFASNYFYDENGKVDPLLNDGVESPATDFIDEYANETVTSGVNPPKEVLRFVTTQMMRTPAALTQALNAIDAYTSSIIKKIWELNGFPEEISNNIKLELKNPRSILAYITATSIVQWPLIKDLGQRLLINGTTVPFVISDHPVVQYNKYLQDCADPAKTSLPARGLIIFMPISSKVTLCLYDKEVYRFKNRHQPHTLISKIDDIDSLNSLQAMNREDSIIFLNKDAEVYVKKLCRKFKPNSLHTSRSGRISATTLQDGKLTSGHYVFRIQAKVEKWVSVISIRKRAQANKNVYAHRVPETVAQQEIIMANLKKRWEEKSAEQGLATSA